ncbi:thiamine pyrophosphate-binding protein [Mucilaginibacter sp.]|uniref:thiamine pyrophosphate-binding protein n=1 Tax=Mucilaginibacter sp. TaxID=1882438 RepID=UPI00261D40CA|nr:thiamine pyrophosphate-binding protein [Mucilaginibacter sp.]MDB4926309.1 acetolactate synthase isozyme 1 large subunit-like [Mucilaginibacter sp.]
MKMKVSDFIADFLVKNTVKHVFSISGAGNIHLLNSILDNKDLVSIHPHQEQCGVLASIAYYRVCNRLGVMITTSGGAATNAITGVLDAWADSIPCIVISGQEKSQFVNDHKNLRMWGVQGFDIAKTVSNITKYAVLITDVKQVKYELQKSFYLALADRPGPVWLDIPTDLQAMNVDFDLLPDYDPVEDQTNKTVANIDYNELVEKINKAERPLFIFGNGVRLAGGQNVLKRLVDKLGVPFLLAWNGVDLLPSNHPLNFGREGTYGQRTANLVVQNCDLLITVGTRMAIPQIGYELNEFARAAQKIIIDIDETELSKFSADPSFTLHKADAKEFIEGLLSVSKPVGSKQSWIDSCKKLLEKFPVIDNKLYKSTTEINSYQFIDKLSNHFSNDEIILTDMGTALTCTHQAIKLKNDQRVITSTGLGEMGYGIPGAVGASLASDKKQVILISGDGSMMMNLQELQTIVHHKLPIKLFVYINDGYLTIKHTQHNLFGNKLAGSGAASGVSCPNYTQIANAFGIKAYQLEKPEDIDSTITKVLDEEGPVLCEVYINALQPLVPKTSFNINPDGKFISPPLEDLFPFIDREELKQAMIVPVHEKSLAIKS